MAYKSRCTERSLLVLSTIDFSKSFWTFHTLRVHVTSHYLWEWIIEENCVKKFKRKREKMQEWRKEKKKKHRRTDERAKTADKLWREKFGSILKCRLRCDTRAIPSSYEHLSFHLHIRVHRESENVCFSIGVHNVTRAFREFVRRSQRRRISRSENRR